MLQIELDPWQQEVLDAKGNIVLRSGRQVGKSTVVSQLAGEFAINNPNKTIMVIASVERQAFLLLEKIIAYLEFKDRKVIANRKQAKGVPVTKSKVHLKNGAVIHCLPTGLSGHGIRGYTVDLLIADEAAFIPEEVWTAVTPMLAITKGRIILLSTPHGRQGYFYRCFQDDKFTNFHVSAEECPRKDQDFLDAERARMTKAQYAQEYLGVFSDDLTQFFPDKLIEKCMKVIRKEHIEFGKDYYLGVDIARMGMDESTFEILEKREQEMLIHIESQITTKTYLNQTTEHITQLDRLYNFRKMYIDDGGIGVGVFDHLLAQEQTKRRVVAINNAKRVYDRDDTKKKLLKEDLYNNLLRLMEQNKIQLLDDPEIFQSFKSVQFEYTSESSGKPMLRIFGNYTHIVEGLIRAAWCVKDKHLKLWISHI